MVLLTTGGLPALAALEIGDAAPPLTIAEWVKGEPVDLQKESGARVPAPESRLPENGLEVLIRRADGIDVEILYEHVENVRGDKGGQAGTEANSLDPQVE